MTYNPVNKNPFSFEKENRNLCGEIVTACQVRGMECHTAIKLGAVNPYGSTLNTAQLQDYLAKISGFPILSG